MRVKHGRWLLIAGLLAGCAAGTTPRLPLPAEPIPVRAQEGASIPVASSYSEVLVRTFVEDAEGRRREVGGAGCRLEVGSFGVAFPSPGRVLVPVPAGGAPVLGVGCTAGALQGTARRAPTRAWADPYPFAWRYPWGRPYGWLGDPYRGPRSRIWLGAGVGDPLWPRGAYRRGAFVTGYPDVEVLLR